MAKRPTVFVAATVALLGGAQVAMADGAAEEFGNLGGACVL